MHLCVEEDKSSVMAIRGVVYTDCRPIIPVRSEGQGDVGVTTFHFFLRIVQKLGKTSVGARLPSKYLNAW